MLLHSFMSIFCLCLMVCQPFRHPKAISLISRRLPLNIAPSPKPTEMLDKLASVPLIDANQLVSLESIENYFAERVDDGGLRPSQKTINHAIKSLRALDSELLRLKTKVPKLTQSMDFIPNGGSFQSLSRIQDSLTIPRLVDLAVHNGADVRCGLLVNALTLCRSRGDWRAALHVYNIAKQELKKGTLRAEEKLLQPSSVPPSAIIPSTSGSGSDTKDRGAAQQPVLPAVIYGQTAVALALGGAEVATYQVMCEMLEAGIAPTELTILHVFNGLSKVGAYKVMVNIMEMLGRYAVPLPSPVPNTIINACDKSEAYGDLVAMYGFKIKANQLDGIGSSVMLKAYDRLCDPLGAALLVRDMLLLDHTLSVEHTSFQRLFAIFTNTKAAGLSIKFLIWLELREAFERETKAPTLRPEDDLSAAAVDKSRLLRRYLSGIAEVVADDEDDGFEVEQLLDSQNKKHDPSSILELGLSASIDQLFNGLMRVVNSDITTLFPSTFPHQLQAVNAEASSRKKPESRPISSFLQPFYDSTICTLARLGRTAQARRTLDSFISRGGVETVAMYTNIIYALRLERDVPAAELLFKQLRRRQRLYQQTRDIFTSTDQPPTIPNPTSHPNSPAEDARNSYGSGGTGNNTSYSGPPLFAGGLLLNTNKFRYIDSFPLWQPLYITDAPFNAMLAVYSYSRANVHRSDSLLREMEVREMPWTSYTYSALIIKNFNSTRVLELWDKLVKGRVPPTASTVAEVLKACVFLGNGEKALEVLEWLWSNGSGGNRTEDHKKTQRGLSKKESNAFAGVIPDRKMCGYALSACLRGGRDDLTLRLLEMMRDNDLPPSPPLYIIALRTLEKQQSSDNTFGKQVTWRSAVNLLVKMYSRSSPMPTQQSQQHNNPRVGTERVAIGTINSPTGSSSTSHVAIPMSLKPDTYVDRKTLKWKNSPTAVNLCMSACGKAGEWAMITKLYDQMPKLAAFQPDLTTYGHAIHAACSLQDARKASEILKKFLSSLTEPLFWSSQMLSRSPRHLKIISCVSQVLTCLESLGLYGEIAELFERYLAPLDSRTTSTASIISSPLILLERVMARNGAHSNSPGPVGSSGDSGDDIDDDIDDDCSHSDSNSVANGISSRRDDKESILDLHGFNAPFARAAVRALLYRLKAAAVAGTVSPATQRNSSIGVDSLPLLYQIASPRRECEGLQVKLANTNIAGPASPSVVLITGIGWNSKEPLEPVLKPVLQAWLKSGFHPALYAVELTDNPGRLVISGEAIRDWIDHGYEKAPAGPMDRGNKLFL